MRDIDIWNAAVERCAFILENSPTMRRAAGDGFSKTFAHTLRITMTNNFDPTKDLASATEHTASLAERLNYGANQARVINKCFSPGVLVQPHPEELLREAAAYVSKPIDVVLFCPACREQHIDAPEDWDPSDHPDAGGGKMNPLAKPWSNPPHKSHLCHHCRHIWRAADVPTNGVRQPRTRGTRDTYPSLTRGDKDTAL